MPQAKDPEEDRTQAEARRSADSSARREHTRAKLLEAAFRLIGHEQGLSIRIEEICASARASRGTFYNYFASLDDLFAALSVELAEDFNRAMVATISALPTNAERCDAAMRFYLARSRSDPAWGWAMVHICAHGPLFGANTFAAALETVEEGLSTKEFDVVDAKVGRDLVLGAAYAGMSRQLREGSPADTDRQLSRTILRGLGVPDVRASRIVERELPAQQPLGTPD